MPKVTWKGEPGAPDAIEQYGVSFTRGIAATVSGDHPHLGKFAGNPQFDVETEGNGDSDPDDDAPFTPVHKGRGRWIVEGPEGTPDAGPFSKDEAVEYADKANSVASETAAP